MWCSDMLAVAGPVGCETLFCQQLVFRGHDFSFRKRRSSSMKNAGWGSRFYITLMNPESFSTYNELYYTKA